MITVLDYFKEAEFALASYANLFAGVAGDQLITALGTKGVSFEYLFDDQPCLVAHALS